MNIKVKTLCASFIMNRSSIDLDGIRLPQGEASTREAIASTEKKELLGESGDEFELTLPFTQTDGRFSGGSHGFVMGHFTPKDRLGGPVAQVRDGDPITIDAQKQPINLEISASELRRRRKAWKAPKLRYTRGVLAKCASAVGSASLGAVTDRNLKL